MPASQQAASVGIMPTLNRKIAIAAATESRSAQRSTLARFGASKASRKARTDCDRLRVRQIDERLLRVLADLEALGVGRQGNILDLGMAGGVNDGQGVRAVADIDRFGIL